MISRNNMAKRILIADDSVTIQKAFAMTFAGADDVTLTSARSADEGMAMAEIQRQMEELQRRSDEIRGDYARDATTSPVRPSDPRFASTGSPASTGGEKLEC